MKGKFVMVLGAMMVLPAALPPAALGPSYVCVSRYYIQHNTGNHVHEQDCKDPNQPPPPELLEIVSNVYLCPVLP